MKRTAKVLRSEVKVLSISDAITTHGFVCVANIPGTILYVYKCSVYSVTSMLITHNGNYH